MSNTNNEGYGGVMYHIAVVVAVVPAAAVVVVVVAFFVINLFSSSLSLTSQCHRCAITR